MHRDTITADVAARLVAAQFPQWAALPVVPVKLNGWDNTTFRLGDELSVRLPSADQYTAQIAKEHRWLPVLAPSLPLPIPVPVAMGRPSDDFPRPWSVYRWIAGEPAGAGQVADLVRFASSLAGFLAALQAIDAGGGPPAGEHNFFRGGPLATYDQQTRQLIRLLADDVDASAATMVWDAALASTWERRPVWVHGDVTGSNLLVADGAIHAVIDFGGLAVGDPACDLVMEWTFFTGDSAAAFRRGLCLDEATWARGRGWALWKALLMIGEENERRGGGHDAARRFGWRYSPRQIVDLVIADHGRLAGRPGMDLGFPGTCAAVRGGGQPVPEIGYVRTVVNGVPVVATPEEIDITTADRLRTALLDLASGGHPKVIVDMTRTQFCDSTGLSALIRTYERIAAEDRELRLVLPEDGIVPYIMALTGVDRFIPCFTSIEEALAHTPDGADPTTT